MKRACIVRGCGRFVEGANSRGRCPVHVQTTTQRGYGSDWQRFRLGILRRDGRRCQVRGPSCSGLATEVDHIVALAHGGGRLDPDNARASCRSCNGSLGGQTRRWP